MVGESKTYVLVHGAWHGGWCWRAVADALRAKGHRVFTPTQTGLGERKHLLSREITLHHSRLVPNFTEARVKALARNWEAYEARGID